MHKFILTVFGRRTQMRTCNFALQVAQCQYENYILGQCISTLDAHLLDLDEEDPTSINKNANGHLENVADHSTPNVSINQSKFWNYHNEDIPRTGKYTGRGYCQISSVIGHDDHVVFYVSSNKYFTSKSKKPLHQELLYAINGYSLENKWRRSVSITRYTSDKIGM